MKILMHIDYRSDGIEGRGVIFESKAGHRYIVRVFPDGCALDVFTQRKHFLYHYDTGTTEELVQYIFSRRISKDVKTALITYLEDKN